MGRAKMIREVGEKELIRSVIKPLLNPADDPNSVGDDCAVVQAEAGSLFCLSTDRVPADLISFRLGIITHRGLGYYLAILNLSDLAAMGAKPSGLLLNLGLPPDTLVDDLVAFLRGARDACTEYGCRILGGDLSNSIELSLSATSFGTVAQSDLLRRRGASRGDLIFCANPIGMTATAFAYFLRAKPRGFALGAPEEDRLKEQFRKPRARFDIARALGYSDGQQRRGWTDAVRTGRNKQRLHADRRRCSAHTRPFANDRGAARM
jgi:thiamine-monophosphate kinase